MIGIIKKSMVGVSVITLMLTSLGAGVANAAEITGTTGSSELTINVAPTIISAVVPTTIVANIDPNKEVIDYSGDVSTDTTDTFIAPEITVENKSNAPITVAVEKITAQSGSPELVNHDKFSDADWKNLNKAGSADNFALGFNGSVVGGDWFTPGGEYAVNTVSRKDSVTFGIRAKYGLSYQDARDFKYDIVYKLALA